MRILSLFAIVIMLFACQNDDIILENSENQTLEYLGKISQLNTTPCATPNLYKNSRFDLEDYSNSKNTSNDLISINVKYHIIQRSDGSGGVPVVDIATMNANLNNYFDSFETTILINENPNIKLMFNQASINYIQNDDYYDLANGPSVPVDEYYNMVATDNDPSMLNIYIVSSLQAPNGQLAPGRAGIYSNSLAIIFTIGEQHLGTTLAHEVGHCFGLRHTHQFDPSTDSQCLDENYADNRGDYIMDTPLDLNLIGNVSSSNCSRINDQFTPCNEQIPEISYSYNIGNFMSYATRTCRTYFTVGQYLKMHNYVRLSNLNTPSS